MNAPSLDQRLYEVLNAIALKKMSTAAGVAEATTLDPAAVSESVDTLVSRDLVADLGGQLLPTDDSVDALVESAAQLYADLREAPEVLDAADRFDDVNARFLTTMSKWQQIDVGGRKLPNDHTDADYDQKIIDQLHRLVARLERLLEPFIAHEPRFGAYADRFQGALDAVDSGETSLVSDPTRDSVHNIWFEFHEDLLRTLGRARKE